MALSVLHWLSSCYHTCQQLHVQPREVYLDTEPGHPDTSQWWSPPWPGGRGASSACRWGRTSTALSWSLTACRVKYLESKVRPAVCSNYQSAHSPFNISKSVKSRPTLSIPNMESSWLIPASRSMSMSTRPELSESEMWLQIVLWNYQNSSQFNFYSSGLYICKYPFQQAQATQFQSIQNVLLTNQDIFFFLCWKKPIHRITTY